MTHHLTDEQLIGYIHHTLTDAEREDIDQHLVECPICRANLDENETLHRQIRNNLSTDLRQTHPSRQMNFAPIAPHVKRKRRLMMFVKQSNQVLYGTATLIILLSLGIGLVMFFSRINPSILTSAIPSPIDVIEALETAHNAQDVDAIVALYAEDGIEKNGSGTYTGSEEIAGLYRWVVKSFQVDYSNYQVEGDKIFYNGILIINDRKVKGEKYEAVVENGKIKTNLMVGTFDPTDQSAKEDSTQIDQPAEQPPTATPPPTVAMFRGNPQRTGVYNDTATPPRGELLWKFETESDVLSSPTVSEGVVYVGSNDHHLYAINSQPGKRFGALILVVRCNLHPL